MGVIAGAPSYPLRAAESTADATVDKDRRQLAKLSLSTDFGAPAHWGRVVEFARAHSISRLVYWGVDAKDIYLYPKYSGLLPADWRAEVEEARERIRSAAAATRNAGMEFWFVFQVLEVPVMVAVEAVWNRPSLAHARRQAPQLFNKYGEPDMSSDRLYDYIREQLHELHALVPDLSGIEMWVVEDAGVQIASLEHQEISMEAICGRLVDSVHDWTSHTGIRLDVDLHTAGGDPNTRNGLLRAAQRHGDVIVSADNVIGDFNLFLPFHQGLVEAAATNPIAVHFDFNGEYWGRNFVPTSALSQYASHIEEARKLGALYLDGRVATIHNRWSPHANVLPSRAQFYPAIAKTSPDLPLPPDLNIPSTDTLGCFNAEFFCRKVRDSQTQPQEVLVDFLHREFGEHSKSLVPAFLRLQHTLGNLFFADTNYYGFQSVLPDPTAMDLGYLSDQLLLPAGTEFPTADIRKVISAKTGYKFAFAGWPTPEGHLCGGTSAIIFDKQAGLEEAQEILREVRKAAQELASTDRDFLVRLFEDLQYFARARRDLIEAQIHYFLLRKGKQMDGFPDRSRLESLCGDIQVVIREWEHRYPGGRYLLAERLKQWLPTLTSIPLTNGSS